MKNIKKVIVLTTMLMLVALTPGCGDDGALSTDASIPPPTAIQNDDKGKMAEESHGAFFGKVLKIDDEKVEMDLAKMPLYDPEAEGQQGENIYGSVTTFMMPDGQMLSLDLGGEAGISLEMLGETKTVTITKTVYVGSPTGEECSIGDIKVGSIIIVKPAADDTTVAEEVFILE